MEDDIDDLLTEVENKFCSRRRNASEQKTLCSTPQQGYVWIKSRSTRSINLSCHVVI